MKKILVIGDDGLSSGFTEEYAGKYRIYTERSSDLNTLGGTKGLFKMSYDAVVFFDEAYTLREFNAVRFACSLYGVSNLILVSDCLDLDTSRHAVGVSEADSEKYVPVSAKGIDRYLTHKLALRTKSATVLRCGAVYGRGSVYESEEADIMSHALTGKKLISIKNEKTYSAIYAEDLYKIITLFIENKYEKGLYNVAAPTPVTKSDFAKKAKAYAKRAGRDIAVIVGEGVGEFTLKVDKLTSALGVFKFTSPGTGINKSLDFYKAHKSLLRREKEEAK